MAAVRKYLKQVSTLIEKLKLFHDAESGQRVKHYCEQAEEIKLLLIEGDKAPPGRE